MRWNVISSYADYIFSQPRDLNTPRLRTFDQKEREVHDMFNKLAIEKNFRKEVTKFSLKHSFTEEVIAKGRAKHVFQEGSTS